MTNWGILGTGNIAKTFASAIKETDRSTLLAVGSRSKGSADLFASTYNCIGFDDYQKLLDDKDINSIYISTPHTSHFEFSYKALMNGKSVLCEKPLVLNNGSTAIMKMQASQLVERAEKANKIASEKVKNIKKIIGF